MARKHVLLIGLDPALVDFSSAPRWDAGQVRAAGSMAHERLAALGCEVQSCLIDLGDTAETVIADVLSRHDFDCIMIGAGVRALPEHTLLFEKIINLIHRHAPSAKLCFNTNPADTVEAVQRWL